MTDKDFRAYLAACYGIKPSESRVEFASNMAASTFGGRFPWSWARKEVTLTSDANGIITFDDDFDGTITMRERESSSGGYIWVWAAEKFDYEIPRLDNLSGSYPAACKLYEQDGTWYGQLAPPVASMSIYVLYKKKIFSVSEIPDKHTGELAAMAHSLMVTPDKPEYASSKYVAEQEIKRAWKRDRKNWASIFSTIDNTNVREYARWWGTWSW